MKNIKKISSITLAAGETLFENKQENKFFFNSLINSKKLFFEEFGIKNNYFLISNETIYREDKVSKLIFNKEIVNYGSLGSLIFFLNNISSIPDQLVINYLDKKISEQDFHNLLNNEKNKNIISATMSSEKNSTENESFFYKEKNYIFNGFIILEKRILNIVKNLNKDYFYLNIPYLFNSNIFKNINLEIQENKYPIQEIREKIDIAEILLGSKSKSLKNLRNIKTAKIPKFKTFYQNDIKNLEQELFGFSNKIIIRSDSDTEDSWNESNAGKYLSIGPVDKNDLKKVKDSIKMVLSSYPSKNINNRVIIQNYVQNIKNSGVITTRLIQNGAPYYCISLSESITSDDVTSGKSNKIKNIYIHKNVNKLDKKYKKYQKLLNFIKELIEITNYELLDIEFATSKNNQVNLLQVRPLLLKDELQENKKELIKNIRKFQQLQNKHQNIFGSKTILSNMSDWNPAEMLGESPNYLSLSLYKTFITNDSWYVQRKEFGYRGEVDQQLMFNFGNKCYIDIRGSLNSFLTKSLDANECEQIIDYQVEKLKNNPELHDKIEFEIAETAYIFGMEKKLNKIYKQILPKSSIQSWIDDLKKLENNYEKILNINNVKINTFYKNLSPKLNFLDKRTINSIKKNMSVPFSHHARLAFIFFSHLNYFVQKEVITSEEKQNLLNNLQTISSQFSKHLIEVKNKNMSYKKFIHTYGHIRPNNYDLNSNNISEKGESFINFLIDNIESGEHVNTDIKKPLKTIDNFLNKNNYRMSSEQWHSLFKKSISSRESSKFMYSKAIDLTLNQLNNEEVFDSERLTDLDFELFIKTKEISYVDNYSTFELPDVLIDSNDFLFFENLNTKPNFIGNNLTKGSTVLGTQNNISQLKNKIILLPNADPGWDWVFSLPIKGLITKYGGPNSHMAIRAAEKNIVSVFGVGEDLFKQIQKSKIVEIDPKNKKLYFNS